MRGESEKRPVEIMLWWGVRVYLLALRRLLDQAVQLRRLQPQAISQTRGFPWNHIVMGIACALTDAW